MCSNGFLQSEVSFSSTFLTEAIYLLIVRHIICSTYEVPHHISIISVLAQNSCKKHLPTSIVLLQLIVGQIARLLLILRFIAPLDRPHEISNKIGWAICERRWYNGRYIVPILRWVKCRWLVARVVILIRCYLVSSDFLEEDLSTSIVRLLLVWSKSKGLRIRLHKGGRRQSFWCAR